MKKWYQSKVVWFSVLYAVLQIAALFGYADFVPGDELVYYVNLGVAVLTGVLRAVKSNIEI